ncbi:MAG: quinoprotein relay system zinc metallohydrolase 2 [Burkholderiaceae bacterium]
MRAASCVFWASFALLAGVPAAAAIAPLPMERIAPGVFVHEGEQAETSAANRGDIANIGFVVGKRCVAVIDTGGSAAIGAALREAVRSRTGLPVCYVINTHMHPDHVFGNAAFLPDAPTFVGHANLPMALAARRDSYHRSLADSLGEQAAERSRLVPPTKTVASTLLLDLGGRTLELRAWPTAHTDTDVTVLDRATGTLWLGDLLFVDRIPALDGSLKGWLTAVAALRQMDPQHVIPGHGPPSDNLARALDPEAHYLERLLTDVRRAIRNGETLSQAVDSVRFDGHRPWLLFDDYHRRNVTAAYTELEWE